MKKNIPSTGTVSASIYGRIKKQLIQRLQDVQSEQTFLLKIISERSNTLGNHMSDCCHHDDTVISRINELRREIRKIGDCLTRIEQGNYGICGRCGKQIPLARLEAYPCARLCIECKMREETRHAAKKEYKYKRR